MDRCISRMAYVLKNMTTFSYEGDHIQQFTLEGTFTGKKSTNIQFGWLWSITTMLDDRILVIDFKGKEVYILK